MSAKATTAKMIPAPKVGNEAASNEVGWSMVAHTHMPHANVTAVAIGKSKSRRDSTVEITMFGS